MSRHVFSAWLAMLLLSAPASAGMPAPLPNDYEQVLRLTDSAHERLQAISFFLAGLLVAAAVVQFLWNFLRKDFATLPRLGYAKALCGVVLWGLLSFVVLTMISGARELMTPGAWQKQGATYRLTREAQADADPSWIERRRQQIEDLRDVLWRFAALTDGRFPEGSEDEAVDRSVWFVPGGRLRYVYVPGLRADTSNGLLAAEPELDDDQRWILLTSGEVRLATTGEVERLLGSGADP